jgi:hypothetical protein
MQTESNERQAIWVVVEVANQPRRNLVSKRHILSEVVLPQVRLITVVF